MCVALAFKCGLQIEADTGLSGIWTVNMVPILQAGQTYISAVGSLGWALPASLGAKWRGA